MKATIDVRNTDDFLQTRPPFKEFVRKSEKNARSYSSIFSKPGTGQCNSPCNNKLLSVLKKVTLLGWDTHIYIYENRNVTVGFEISIKYFKITPFQLVEYRQGVAVRRDLCMSEVDNNEQ